MSNLTQTRSNFISSKEEAMEQNFIGKLEFILYFICTIVSVFIFIFVIYFLLVLEC